MDTQTDISTYRKHRTRDAYVHTKNLLWIKTDLGIFLLASEWPKSNPYYHTTATSTTTLLLHFCSTTSRVQWCLWQQTGHCGHWPLARCIVGTGHWPGAVWALARCIVGIGQEGTRVGTALVRQGLDWTKGRNGRWRRRVRRKRTRTKGPNHGLLDLFWSSDHLEKNRKFLNYFGQIRMIWDNF